MNETRNPYVALGIPFGASRDLAAAAFARQARGLRRAPNGAQRLQHLTWALNQVEEALKDPRLALEIYRVPADPEAFNPGGGGLLAPLPIPLDRKTKKSATQHKTVLVTAQREALQAVRAELAQSAELPAR